MKFARATLVGVAIATLLPLLAACSFIGGPDLAFDVAKQLPTGQGAHNATVDFTKLVPGDWTRIIIACGPVDADEINTALGFTWSTSAPTGKINSAVMLFATASTVTYSYLPGTQGADWYFTPCFPIGQGNEHGPNEVRQVFEVTRAHATIPLRADHTPLSAPIWYITESERDLLAQGDRGVK